MRKHNLFLRLVIGVCLLILSIVLTNVCFAQGEESPQQPYNFSYIQVKPGMALEFEELIKNYLPTFRTMGLPGLDVWKTANYGMSDKYVFITEARDPAELDAEINAPQNSMPISLVAALSAFSRLVDSAHDFIVIPRPDLNIDPAEDYELKLAVHLTIGTAPDRSQDFENGVKEVLSVIGKTDVKGVYVSKVGYGGNLDEYLVSVFYDSFADMTKNTAIIEQKMAEAKLTPQSGVVYYRQSEILVRIPELSFTTEQ